MEIDSRKLGEGERVPRVLEAVGALGPGEVLTLLSAEDPAPVAESVRNVLGDSVDLERVRWGLADLPWLLHVKRSRKPSSR